MATYIAHASIDENGNTKGGQVGDQGSEVCTRDWYQFAELVLRYNNSDIAKQAAEIATKLANSNLVGYDQNSRNTLYQQLKKNKWDVDKYIASGVPTETDCSAFVYACFACVVKSIRSDSNGPTTTNLKSRLISHGFTVSYDSKYLTSGSNLIPGDILVKQGSHAVIVVSSKGEADPTGFSDGDIQYISPQSKIDASKLTPYIATIDTSCVGISYKKLSNIGVVGVMFYGGCYYDGSHMPRKYYAPANIKAQVAQADKANMPYAIYVDVKARSVSEAKLECESLYYVISKYPPELGIWLHIKLSKSTSINNSIVDTYYNKIVEWGLKDKCGLYVTRKQLEKITWEKFYDKYLLWLVDHVSDMSKVDDKLLEPEFFMLKK